MKECVLHQHPEQELVKGPNLKHAVPRSVVFGALLLRPLAVNPDRISAGGTGSIVSFTKRTAISACPANISSWHVVKESAGTRDLLGS